MGQNGTVKKYELMVIVDAKLSGEEKDSIWKEAGETLMKAGGKIVSAQVWLEKHKFAFAIKKCREGTYYLVIFEGENAVNGKVNSLLKLNERILRFSIVKAEA